MEASNKLNIYIDKEALTWNVQVFSDLLGSVDKIGAVVKGDAYGHGDIFISGLYEVGVRQFCVFSVSEALLVDSLTGSDVKILILGPVAKHEVIVCAENDYSVSIYGENQWNELANFLDSTSLTVKVHIKIDTGMHRLGLPHNEFEDILKEIHSHSGVEVVAIYTHLAESGNLSFPSFTQMQQDRFLRIIANYNLDQYDIHIANTGACISLPSAEYTFTRIGIGLCGYWPNEQFYDEIEKAQWNIPDLKPVIRWKSEVSGIRDLNGGESLGYSLTYTAESNREIAVIPIGYADGFPFALGNKGFVLIEDTLCPIVGQVNMNYLTVDVTHMKPLSKGQEVILLGKSKNNEISPLDWVNWAEELFIYEVICNLRSSIANKK